MTLLTPATEQKRKTQMKKLALNPVCVNRGSD